MQNFTEQFYTALAWFTAFGLGIFVIWLFASVFEWVHLRARRRAFKKPEPRDNPVYDFVQDWCDRTPGARTYAGDLYEAYRIWCKDNEAEPTGRHIFGRRLAEMNFKREKAQWIMYLDLELNPKGRRRIAVEEKANR